MGILDFLDSVNCLKFILSFIGMWLYMFFLEFIVLLEVKRSVGFFKNFKNYWFGKVFKLFIGKL